MRQKRLRLFYPVRNGTHTFTAFAAQLTSSEHVCCVYKTMDNVFPLTHKNSDLDALSQTMSTPCTPRRRETRSAALPLVTASG